MLCITSNSNRIKVEMQCSKLNCMRKDTSSNKDTRKYVIKTKNEKLTHKKWIGIRIENTRKSSVDLGNRRRKLAKVPALNHRNCSKCKEIKSQVI